MEKKVKNPTLEKVTEILRNYKDDQTLEVTMESKFADYDLDSLDAVDLAMTIEDEMKVKITMSAEIVTIGHIVDIIEAQLKKG